MVPGQSVFLRSGREALLVETIENSNALVVVGTGGKANVVEETTKGKLTKLPLSVLKDFEAVAALAAGEAPPGAVSGAELVKQVGGILYHSPAFRRLSGRTQPVTTIQHCPAVGASPPTRHTLDAWSSTYDLLEFWQSQGPLHFFACHPAEYIVRENLVHDGINYC